MLNACGKMNKVITYKFTNLQVITLFIFPQALSIKIYWYKYALCELPLNSNSNYFGYQRNFPIDDHFLGELREKAFKSKAQCFYR